MNTDTVIKFRERCIRVANRYRYRNDAEDFASWATIKYLEGRKADIYHLLVDYLRETRGDTRSDNFKIVNSLKYHYSLLPEHKWDDETYPNIETTHPRLIAEDTVKCSTPSFEDDLVKKLDDSQWITKLTHRQREIVELLKMGYLQNEIGFILEISESRVSQIVRFQIPKRLELAEKRGEITTADYI